MSGAGVQLITQVTRSPGTPALSAPPSWWCWSEAWKLKARTSYLQFTFPHVLYIKQRWEDMLKTHVRSVSPTKQFLDDLWPRSGLFSSRLGELQRTMVDQPERWTRRQTCETASQVFILLYMILRCFFKNVPALSTFVLSCDLSTGVN